MASSIQNDISDHARRLVDHLPSMLAYWDRDLRCRFANRAYLSWFGVDPEAMIGTSLRELLGPELFALNEPYVNGALRGEQQVFERIVPGPGGRKRHSLATYVPDIEAGQVVGFMAHVTEVTRLKETEAALRAEIVQREQALERLREKEHDLSEAQRLGQIGSWTWDVDSDTTIWSDELCRILGHDPRLPPPPLAQQAQLYTASSWTRLQAAQARAIETGEPYMVELEVAPRSGQARWIEARGEAVRGEGGRVTRICGTALDVTQRRAIEETRLRLQVAEAANRNKTDLLSRVSHELRTPLNGILGFAQLCQNDPALALKHREWAELILGSGRHMLSLVDEILDLSSAEMGRLPISPTNLALGIALRESLALARGGAARAGLRLIEPGASELQLAVRADPLRLRQVADNLLSNAIKYTAAGGSVTVSTARLDDDVELRVADTGPGLSPEQLGQIFMPFNRLGAEKSRIPGTGLGLALSKYLVESMGGSIRVTSQVGQGSVFVVTLPLGRD